MWTLVNFARRYWCPYHCLISWICQLTIGYSSHFNVESWLIVLFLFLRSHGNIAGSNETNRAENGSRSDPGGFLNWSERKVWCLVIDSVIFLRNSDTFVEGIVLFEVIDIGLSEFGCGFLFSSEGGDAISKDREIVGWRIELMLDSANHSGLEWWWAITFGACFWFFIGFWAWSAIVNTISITTPFFQHFSVFLCNLFNNFQDLLTVFPNCLHEILFIFLWNFFKLGFGLFHIHLELLHHILLLFWWDIVPFDITLRFSCALRVYSIQKVDTAMSLLNSTVDERFLVTCWIRLINEFKISVHVLDNWHKDLLLS